MKSNVCAKDGIDHRLIKLRHPQTHGMVERFNGRSSDILATARLRSRDDLQITITHYRKLYNETLPQKALGHSTPLQAIRTWRQQQPELFVRKLKNQTGLDTYGPVRRQYRRIQRDCSEEECAVRPLEVLLGGTR